MWKTLSKETLVGVLVVAVLAVANVSSVTTLQAACAKECGYEGEFDRGEREDCENSCKWVRCGGTTSKCMATYGLEYAPFNDHCFSWLECAPLPD